MSEINIDLERMTVPDLKSILASKGLPTSGRKLDLISRIRSTDVKKDEVNDIPEFNLESTKDEINLVTIESQTKTIIVDDLQNGIESVEKIEIFTSEREEIELEEANEDVDNKPMETNVIQNLSNTDTVQNEFADLETNGTILNEDEIMDNGIEVNHEGENFFEEDKDIDKKTEEIITTNENKKEVEVEEAKSRKSPGRLDVHSYRKDIKKRTIYIRNIYDELNDDLKSMMKTCETYSCRFSKDHTNPELKSGYIELKFATLADAKEAVEKLKGLKIHEREIEIRHHTDDQNDILEKEKSKPEAELNPQDLKTIYIGNLPTSATKEMLKVIFSDAKGYEMPLDNTGKPKGHAYLEYETEDDAKKALETYAGVKIDDGENTRQLTLMLASEYKKEKTHSKSRERRSHPPGAAGSSNNHRQNNSRKHDRERGFDRRSKMMKRDHERFDRRGGRDSGRNFNTYKNDWKSGSSMNQGIMNRVNPQAAMNLLVGVSQLLTQQQQQPSPHMLSSVIRGGGGGRIGGMGGYDSYASGGGGGRRRYDNYEDDRYNRNNRLSGGGGGGPSRRGGGNDRRY